MMKPYAKVTGPDPFIRLMSMLRTHYGSIDKTCAAIGISDHSYYKLMQDRKVCKVVATKILEAYNKARGA